MRLLHLIPAICAVAGGAVADLFTTAKFTPEILLGAPRRGAAVPNHDGTASLYSITQFSFDTETTSSEIRVLDIKTKLDSLVTSVPGAAEPRWLDDKNIVLLAAGKDGSTDIIVGDVDEFNQTNYTIGNIDTSASDLIVKKIGHGEYAFALTAFAKPDGSPYNEFKAQKAKSTGRLYKSTFVRHWDTYITLNRKAIWYGSLASGIKDTRRESIPPSAYKLSELQNVLRGTHLESPVPPFGGVDQYDISKDHVVFVAKDLTLNPGFNTKSNVYIVRVSGKDGVGQPVQVAVPGLEGASTSPQISTDGSTVAFLQMRENGYEADKNQVIVMHDINNATSGVDIFAEPTNKGRWALSPAGLRFGRNGDCLYLLAEDHGSEHLFFTSIEDVQNAKIPTRIASEAGSISSFTELEDGHLFTSGSSFVDSSRYSNLDPRLNSTILVDSFTHNGTRFGLSQDQVSEIYYPGAEQDVHAWVIKPSFYREGGKYPLAFIIHGGPQNSWTDSWSTRWNPAIYAEQGYVVITPNPTGSTGFGQDFTDAIKGEWGGLPYIDLALGFDWIEKNLEYVDTDNAVALGASYGGYMINWMQGQPLGRRFKALVCHDGSFSIVGQLGSEEQWFPSHDFNGRFIDNPDGWKEWDPSNHVAAWATPQLTIHSDLDYRLNIPDGLSAFTVLQSKGIKSQFLEFPDENHWVLKPLNSLMWHSTVLNWINSFVGLGEYKPEEDFPGMVVEPQFGADLLGNIVLADSHHRDLTLDTPSLDYSDTEPAQKHFVDSETHLTTRRRRPVQGMDVL